METEIKMKKITIKVGKEIQTIEEKLEVIRLKINEIIDYLNDNSKNNG